MYSQDYTISEVVRDNFRTAQVFQHYGMDFCCGGKKSLRDACLSRQVPIEELLGELDRYSASPDGMSINRWNEWGIDFLVEYIKHNHHAYIRSAIQHITRYLAKVADKHGALTPSLIELRNVFDAFSTDLISHISKEEQILFPYIGKLVRVRQLNQGIEESPFGSIESPIQVMENEHREAATYLERLRTLTNNYMPPPNACTSWRIAYAELDVFDKDLQQHAFLENYILFPKAATLEKYLLELYKH